MVDAIEVDSTENDSTENDSTGNDSTGVASTEVDVLVVGGGLVGLTLANGLRGSRLSVLVIDSQPVPRASAPAAAARQGFALASGCSPRVSAINLASQALLQRLGAWPADPARQCAFTGMRVWDSRGTAAIEFNSDLTRADHLGSIVENQLLTAALYQQALGLAETELRYDCGLASVVADGAGYRVQLQDGSEIRCRLLVGADGGASRVRELAQIKTLEWSYEQAAMVTTIETEMPHGGIARQCFTATGPLAFLPLPNPHLCSVVWSTAATDELLGLGDEDLCQRLSRASEGVLGKVLGVDRRFSFPLRQRHALRYVKAGLALIGDAAHTIHPLAGQGANLGFADAQALALALQQCRFDETSPGDLAVLQRYERSRRAANLLMTATMEGFKRIFDTGDPGVNWLRNLGVSLLERQGTLKAMVARLATGS